MLLRHTHLQTPVLRLIRRIADPVLPATLVDLQRRLIFSPHSRIYIPGELSFSLVQLSEGTSDPDLVAKSRKRVWFDSRAARESLAYCLNLFLRNGDWLIAEPYEAVETRACQNVEPSLKTAPNENIAGKNRK